MDRVRDRKIVQARTRYTCYLWGRSGYGLDNCETREQRLAVIAAQAVEWRILPRQTYVKVTRIQEGRPPTYRPWPGMDESCTALDLFVD